MNPEPARTAAGRVIGLDLGTRRIGVAVSDAGRRVATGHGVLARTGDVALDHRAVADLLRELDASVVVVGLPLSLSGRTGPAAQAARSEAEALAAALSVPVIVHDERFTTVTAAQSLRAGGARRGARRSRIDETAAAVMLQSWLDAGSPEQQRVGGAR